MVDRVLTVHVRRDCEDADEPKSVPGQKVTKREPEKLIVVQALRVEREYEDQNQKWGQAGDQLKLGIAPIGFAFVSLKHSDVFLLGSWMVSRCKALSIANRQIGLKFKRVEVV